MTTFEEKHEKDKRVVATVTCEVCGHEAEMILSYNAVMENVAEQANKVRTEELDALRKAFEAQIYNANDLIDKQRVREIITELRNDNYPSRLLDILEQRLGL